MRYDLSLRCLVVVALTSAACGGARVSVAPTPVVASPAPDAAAPPAEPDHAAPVPDARRDALLAAWNAVAPAAPEPASIVAGPIAYAEAGAAEARVAAVVARGDSAMLIVTPVPFVAGRQAVASLSLTGAPADVVAGLATRDINGDHRDDVAVFLRREYELEGYLPLQRFALLYTLQTTPERSMAPLIRAEQQLLGVRDEASLAAATQGLDAYEPPAAGLSPVRFIARLRYATPAQFRAAVAPAGLRLCTDLPDRTGVRRKRCTTYPAARLTDAMITGRIRRDLGEFAVELVDDVRQLTTPSCQRVNQEVHCGANVGGPAGTDWSLVGEGAAMRIAEISPWAESS